MFEMILSYCLSMGRGDGGDPMEYEMSLTEQQQLLFDRAILLGLDPNDIPELVEAVNEVREELKADELDKLREYAPEEVGEFTGEYPMDADTINELVAERDPHTLEFFGLEDLDEEELDDWDANDLDELPDRCDFDEDFEPTDPFDYWDLMIDILIPDFDLDDETAEDAFHVLFSDEDPAHEDVCNFIRCRWYDAEENEVDFRQISARVAAELGITDFVFPDAPEDAAE